ncbi:anaerobic C4-dicarboxylate transporter [Corynebacterium uberis]|uniref:anaerobic C4-dicarboxylate transporter n=1 Tax=Corynebacterium TaxID=1716 RepID=UPI001D0BA168|nr:MULTISPECIES: anaerobic C4-dicarboxylate transporter [Corynebacterium]MCZ9308707.1 anaerobic C4-dicarboxylate transporter [Corynebacterium sp. c6VSa_13]UDL74345.1 anaerobic C4-dicarboxylate transporter [Corynebacterium uberis]UDL76822.1 anaerobic C4-dicarboxylate transporter [Corynebacterium uberis]UDL79035.1 anaerobic C4-dicarboxylate transporter [Corynebacterium uberis]UDL79273.1 anaerobic C4-dicarboxylate transporter [Corynebacterium uberis]
MLASVLDPTSVLAIVLQVLVILSCLLVGTRFGGIGLGLISGIGLLVLVFAFGLTPGEPPVSVMLTIVAVIGCAATLQQAGGLDVMMQFAERILRRNPSMVTILAPLTTWTLTVLCGTGHVVYTMFPIIEDIAVKKGIRPERPMAVSSTAAQMGITASPVSVATVSLASILAEHAGVIDKAYSIPQILSVALPASLCGVLLAALWSVRRGKDLDQDPEFQRRLQDPEFREQVYSHSETLIGKVFPASAFRAMYIFFTGIIVVVVLGAFDGLRPSFPGKDGTLTPLSMNLVIQMVMLVSGAAILLSCKVEHAKIASTAVFKAGMTAVFSVFGVAWMADTFFGTHIDALESGLGSVVSSAPWMYAIALLIVSKLVNSQGAALVAIAPIGLHLGIDPAVIVGFYGAAYGYWILPTYPSDLACIGFDTTGTTRIGKFVINHSFLIPGAICVATSCVVGSLLAQVVL